MASGCRRSTTTLAQAGCKTFFVADLAEARTRALARARGHHLCARRLYARLGRRIYRDQCAAGDQLDDRACGVGRLRRRPWLAGRRRAAGRYRHESARHFAGRGGGARPARADRKSRHRAAAEPPRLRRDSRPSAQCPADPAVSRVASAVPERARFARQFLRHFSRRFGAFRFGAAGRCALRRQSNAGPPQSDAERRRADRPHPAIAQRRARRDGRL